MCDKQIRSGNDRGYSDSFGRGRRASYRDLAGDEYASGECSDRPRLIVALPGQMPDNLRFIRDLKGTLGAGRNVHPAIHQF